MSNSLQPVGGSLPGHSVHEISQARILEWVVISSSRGSSWSRDEPGLLHWQVDSLPLSHQGSLWNVCMGVCVCVHLFYCGKKKQRTQRRHTDSQHTQEKMLSVTNHQGNANKTTMRYHFRIAKTRTRKSKC